MAKKIVRGITDVKTINNQDFDTNNVNDLLSDGQYNYIHRKKGKTEEYHNLTDNIKTLSSDNTELLSVTNYNKTTNTATLHPKHDAQKEQVLESTRNTISINHGANGTAEKTTVDTNPQKVLEHENLISDSEYITLEHQQGENATHIQAVKLKEKLDDLQKNKQNKLTGMGGISITGDNISLTTLDSYAGDLNELTYTCLVKPIDNAPNLPTGAAPHGILKVVRISDVVSQQYHTYNNNSVYIRSCKKAYTTPEWTQWVKIVDKSTIDALLAQKQDVLTAGTGITIQDNVISATGGAAPVEGATLSIQDFTPPSYEFSAVKHVVTIAQQTLTTFSFICSPATAEHVITGELKQTLALYLRERKSISNGALTITYDGTTMKLINSAPSENVIQHATFTFYGNAIT